MNLRRKTKEEQAAEDAEAIRKAQNAREVLENPIYHEAVESIRQKHLKAIENSRPSDKEAREDAYHALRMMKKLGEELNAIIDAGKLADKRMKDKA